MGEVFSVYKYKLWGCDFIVYCLSTCIIIILDQSLKRLVEKRIAPNQMKEIVQNKIYVTNIRNKGAAYGLLKDSPFILFVLTTFTLIAVLHSFITALCNDSSKGVKFGLAFILGGGIGNIIDRIVRKYVTDYIYINKKDFPVFNLADMFVMLGIIILWVENAFKE